MMFFLKKCNAGKFSSSNKKFDICYKNMDAVDLQKMELILSKLVTSNALHKYFVKKWKKIYW